VKTRPSKDDAIKLFGLSLTHTTADFPNARNAVSELGGPVPRNVENDPHLCYPPDVYRKPDPVFPEDFKIDLKQMIEDKVVSKIKSLFGGEA
jgi:ribonuclease Z